MRSGMVAMLGAILLCAPLARAAAKKAIPPIDADCPQGFVRQITVVAAKAPDGSSMKSLVDTVTRGCKTNDENLHRGTAPVVPLPLPGRARRHRRPQAHPRVRLEPVRRTTHRARRPLARRWVGLALRRLARTHHRRVPLRQPVALLRHVPQSLRLEARPQRAGRPHGCQPARHQDPAGPDQEAVRVRQAPQGVVHDQQPLRGDQRRGELGGPGLFRVRRPSRWSAA